MVEEDQEEPESTARNSVEFATMQGAQRKCISPTPSLSVAGRLSSADKTDLRTILGAVDVDDQEGEWEARQEAFEAPGWDVEENDYKVGSFS